MATTKIRGKLAVILLPLTFFLMEPTLNASVSPSYPIHHTFNATILEPKQHQLSIFGNYKYGLDETLELGSQLFGLVGPAPNLYLRHQMFDLESSKTAFTTHIFHYQEDGASSVFGYFNINTTWQSSDSTVYSFGLFNLFWTESNGDFLRNDVSLSQIYLPQATIDHYLNPQWVFTGIFVLPVYGTFEVSDDYADIEGRYIFWEARDDLIFFSMATMTYSAPGKFNLELGAIATQAASRSLLTPYLNLFWRW